jgi:small subunit ribosomal protein S14
MVAEYADIRLRLKMLKKTKMLPPVVRAQAKEELKKLPLDSNICRVRNRCVLTDRGRSVVTQFKIGRHKFKQYADAGLLPGVTKSSW